MKIQTIKHNGNYIYQVL